jgi:HK97 gp10 family phage protein
MSIRLQLSGFDDLFEQIKKAEGNVDKAAEQCLEESAQVMQSELKAQMQKSGVDSDLIDRMPTPELKRDGNTLIARVGYKKGAYNPDDLSDGFKVVFANYGTPKRSKHGKVEAKGFIDKAQRKAKKQIKKKQEETLKKIIGELQ